MKKIASLILALTCILSLIVFVGCGDTKKEIVMITDVGDIDDQSFNQGTWDGVKAWAEANKKSYDYIKPASSQESDLNAAIDLAVSNGANVIVTPGFVFAASVEAKQAQYPDVKFVLLDSTVGTPTANTATFSYKAEQSGFLAGYAAVKEGFTKHAYLGGIGYPTVYCFGVGYAQGAEYAAKEMGLASVELTWSYTGNFDDTADNKNKALALIADGTEVIFSVGGKNQLSCFAAAAEKGGWIISPDTDSIGLSAKCLTSALKGLAKTVELALDEVYGKSNSGYFGNNNTLDITDEAVGISTNLSRFTKFTQADYDKVYASLKNGEISVVMPAEDFTADNVATISAQLNLSIVKVTVK